MIPRATIDALTRLHAYQDSIQWRLTPIGIETPAGIETWGGQPKTSRIFWREYGDITTTWASAMQVPAELIVACALTESRGDPMSIREEPGYMSDLATPSKISAGLMQLLISTASEIMRTLGVHVDRAWLMVPDNAIRAGASFIASQAGKTGMDPPKVACAYNAGGIYYQGGEENRWKMRQFPIGTGHHADRFVKWFNECMGMFGADGTAPECSFCKALNP